MEVRTEKTSIILSENEKETLINAIQILNDLYECFDRHHISSYRFLSENVGYSLPMDYEDLSTTFDYLDWLASSIKIVSDN